MKQLDRRISYLTKREYANQNKPVVEHEIRTILEGTCANIVQSGLPEKFWSLAAQHRTMALNLTKRLDVDAIPWDLRFGEPFDAMNIFLSEIKYYIGMTPNIKLLRLANLVLQMLRAYFLAITFNPDSYGWATIS